MTPRPTRRRPSLFPAYEPPADGTLPFEHVAAYFETLARRVVMLGSVLALIAGGAAFFGVRVLSPRETSAQTAAHLKDTDDSLRAHARRITTLETLMQQNLYIGCKVLEKVQPPRAIPPKECQP